jgi:hypothetical protein
MFNVHVWRPVDSVGGCFDTGVCEEETGMNCWIPGYLCAGTHSVPVLGDVDYLGVLETCYLYLAIYGQKYLSLNSQELAAAVDRFLLIHGLNRCLETV